MIEEPPILVVDTETTGMEGEIVEVAIVQLEKSPNPGEIISVSFEHSLIKPNIPIEFGAMAVHHITEDMVKDAPSLDEWLYQEDKISLDSYNHIKDEKVLEMQMSMNTFDHPITEESAIVFAHNAAFDKKFFPDKIKDNDKWFCTWRIANHLFPDAQSFSNQALRYELDLDISDLPEDAGLLPHRGLYDAWCTAMLLERMIRVHYPNAEESYMSLRKMVMGLGDLSLKPILLKNCKFGKHVGKTWEQIGKEDKGYLNWILKSDFDDDTKHTARHWL